MPDLIQLQRERAPSDGSILAHAELHVQTALCFAASRRVVQQTNVAEEAEMRAMLQACLDTFGRVDILVNNSGITGPT